MTVAILGTRYRDFSIEEAVLAPLGVHLRSGDGVTPEGILEEASGAAVIMAGSAPRLDASILSRLDCRGIVRYGVGTETVDLEAAARRGMWVANVPDYGTEAVATHTLALVLAAIRRLPEADRTVKSAGWGIAALGPLHLPSSLTAGVVGLGRIGRRTAAMLGAIGFRIVAHDPNVAIDLPGVEARSLDALLSECDVVILHAPGSVADDPLLGAAELSRMREGSVLVNTARGTLVDQGALLEGLASGRPGFAALDVFAHEPPDAKAFAAVADRLILTPHMAWYTEESEADLRRKAAEEARRILQGDPPLHAVAGPGMSP
jgi:D-3-phosphoglycerate dehydrogenase / 2-oxoglutarate reductase